MPYLYSTVEMSCEDETSRSQTCSVDPLTLVDTVGADVTVINRLNLTDSRRERERERERGDRRGGGGRGGSERGRERERERER